MVNIGCLIVVFEFILDVIFDFLVFLCKLFSLGDVLLKWFLIYGKLWWYCFCFFIFSVVVFKVIVRDGSIIVLLGY